MRFHPPEPAGSQKEEDHHMKKALGLLALTPMMMASTCSDDVIELILTCTSQTTSVTPSGFGSEDVVNGCGSTYAELLYDSGGVIASVYADVAVRANTASAVGSASIEGGDLPGPVTISASASYQFTVPPADPGITTVPVEIRNYGRALDTTNGAVSLAINGAGANDVYDSIANPGERSLTLDLVPGATYDLTLETSGEYEAETTGNAAIALNVSVKVHASDLAL